ncbi:hypothetical protein Btru_017972 [Bulinus truncatus]|nr:hypothetical protein Btru_017972 [Bulinus truncatus]
MHTMRSVFFERSERNHNGLDGGIWRCIVASNKTESVQTVTITIKNNPKENILTLCEVEIYEETQSCDLGKYDRDCEKFCKCFNLDQRHVLSALEVVHLVVLQDSLVKDVTLNGEKFCKCFNESETCFVSTGGCPSGCAAGFTGEGCNTNCEPKRYGVGCRSNCSANCLNESCDNRNGHCKGCVAGREGVYCSNNCSSDKYGINCSQTCSEMCNGTCHPVNGSCVGGCKVGFMGDWCETKCEKGFYGVDCNSPCPENCNNSECNHETGKCIKCKPGYYSNWGTKTEQNFCLKACLDFYYGDDCKHKCSSNCSRSECYHDSGNCKSCIDGMLGDKCDQTSIQKSSTVSVGGHQLTLLKISIISLDANLLLQLVIKLRTLMEKNNDRIVYLCRNGAQYSGLIYLLTMLLDRMDNDHKVSIPLVDQYRWLYKVIQAYLQASHSACHYVNIDINKQADDTQKNVNLAFAFQEK